MGEAIEVDGGESPFTAQIIFSAIEEKKKGGRKWSTSRGRRGLTGRCGREPWRAPSPSAQTFKKLIQQTKAQVQTASQLNSTKN